MGLTVHPRGEEGIVLVQRTVVELEARRGYSLNSFKGKECVGCWVKAKVERTSSEAARGMGKR